MKKTSVYEGIADIYESSLHKESLPYKSCILMIFGILYFSSPVHFPVHCGFANSIFNASEIV